MHLLEWCCTYHLVLDTILDQDLVLENTMAISLICQFYRNKSNLCICQCMRDSSVGSILPMKGALLIQATSFLSAMSVVLMR